jgi:hypothetical protein
MVRFAPIRVNWLVGGKEPHQSRTIPSSLISGQSGYFRLVGTKNNRASYWLLKDEEICYNQKL